MSGKTHVKYVAYHIFGLNRADVADFVAYNKGVLIGEYVERTKRWTRLPAAIERCKQEGAILVVAKLGVLARNARFLTLLSESGLDFACVDNPQCNRNTVPILIAVAEKRAKRTVSGLGGASPRRGRTVSSWDHRPRSLGRPGTFARDGQSYCGIGCDAASTPSRSL